MKRTVLSLLLAAALGALAPSLAAQPSGAPATVTLGDWILRDQAVGKLAPSPERTGQFDALHRDIVAALGAARAAVEAKAAAEAEPKVCLPPPGSVELSAEEIGTWLYTRPQSDYGDSLPEVMERFLAHRFPCR